MRGRTVAIAAVSALLAAAGFAAWPLYQRSRIEARECAFERLPIKQAPGGLSPYVSLAAGNRSGAFLIDYGATTSSISAESLPPEREGKTTVQSFSLPTFAFGTFRVTRYYVSRVPAGGQLGIVGTDFLSLLAADFRFTTTGGEVAFGRNPCLTAGDGLIGISQTGFFSDDPKRLPPNRPNVPVLYLDIGGVRTWAQIDTGYDDAVLPNSIDINEPLYRRLTEAGVELEPESQQELTTCQGREQRQVFRPRTRKVTISTDKGVGLREVPAPRLLLKPRNACGGIAGLDEPAAQIAVSVLRLFERVVFHPQAEMVWVPRSPAAAGTAPPMAPAGASEKRTAAPR